MSPSADRSTRDRTGSASDGAPTVATGIGVLVSVYAITFFTGAALHLGVRIPLGFVVLAEPEILPATIVEFLCGLGLAVSGYGVFARKAWAWTATIAAHGFALAGVLLGIAALAAGGGPSTQLNSVYHATMLVVLSAGLVLLPTRRVKAALGHRGVADVNDTPA